MRVLLQDVSHTYRGREGRRVEALAGVTFAVESEEIVAVVGPSGCGKSTLLNMLGGLLSPTEGRVGFEGDLPSGRPPTAMVFQEFALFPWKTVAGNVAWGLEAQGIEKEKVAETVQAYLELMDLAQFRNHYPAEISGGMKQRVALARVLAFNPKVLLMDEPFGALDAQTRETMQEEVTRIWERTHKTIVFVTHDIEEAVFLGDRVIVLSARPGRIREDIRIELPRPRTLEIKKSAQCHQYRNTIWDLIRRESRS